MSIFKNVFNLEFIHVIQLIGLLYLFNLPFAKSIGCYKCSTTENITDCKDPFNPGSSQISLYEPECKAGQDNRVGAFPARYCLKVSGYRADNQEQIVIRTCTVSKLLDSDSSHSSFTLRIGSEDIKIVSGLIASCKEDGCNSASSMFQYASWIFKCIASLFLVFLIINNYNLL